MKIRSYIVTIVGILIVTGIFLSRPGKTYANSVCTQNPPACVMTQILYSWTAPCNCDIYGNCSTCQYWEWQTRCVIPQSGGGSCQCCFNDGCYLDCPGTQPTSTGGNNNGPTSTPVPNPTATPTPAPGTLRAVAREVANGATCTDVTNSTTPIVGTVFGFTAASVNQPPSQTQTSNTPVTFSNQPVGSYTIDYTLPVNDYVLAAACVYKNGVLSAYGNTADLGGGDTLAWRFGFTKGTAWAQTTGGDVYASGSLRSYIPTSLSTYFSKNGSGGFPGVAIYGTNYDFDSDLYSQGATSVSSKNWLVNATRTSVDYYNYFYHRFGAPTATDNALFSNLSDFNPPSRSTPYYISGNVTTSPSGITVANGETVIVMVEGNLTIGGPIKTTGNGFIAFIVHGNITVADSVGTTAGSSADVVDGVYVATTAAHDGVFDTGYSDPTLTTPKFVGKGMFVADNFLLHRDLENFGGNTAGPAELFIYDPQLIFTMPAGMQDVPVTWQEVAP